MTSTGRAAATGSRSAGRTAGIGLLAVGHAVDDLYQGAVPALLPFLVAAYGWGYAAVSGITVAATLLSSVVQPVFGLLTDRWRLPWLVPAGMAVAGAGVGVAGLSSAYPVVWVAISVSGLGVAAYHPESARLARLAAAGSHQAMSWFSLGGNLGFAGGPLLAGAILGVAGLRTTPLLTIPALACAAVTAYRLRNWHRNRTAAPVGGGRSAPAGSPGGGADAGGTEVGGGRRADWWGFGWLTVVIVCRSVVTFGLGTFLALYVAGRVGGGAWVGEAALVTFYGFGAAGTVLGGWLAGRFARVRVVRWSYAAAVPALAGLVVVPGVAEFGFVAWAAVALYVPFSLHVTLGQDYLPGRVGTASGVTLGLAVSLGGIATPVLGAVADASDLRAALAILIALPAVAAAIAWRLRDPAPAGRLG